MHKNIIKDDFYYFIEKYVHFVSNKIPTIFSKYSFIIIIDYIFFFCEKSLNYQFGSWLKLSLI